MADNFKKFFQVAPLAGASCTTLGIACPAGTTAATIAGVGIGLINAVLIIVGVVALGVLIWGGVVYIISLGNDADIQKAKKIITYAIIGLVVIGLSGLIINVVINLF